MTALEKYQAQRSRISEALKLAGVAETLFNKDNIPKNLPCAILILDSVTGKHGTSRQYLLERRKLPFQESNLKKRT